MKSSTGVSTRADTGSRLSAFVGDTCSGQDHLAVGVRVAARAAREVTVGAWKTAITSTLGLVASNTSLLETLALATGCGVDGCAVSSDVCSANDGLLGLARCDGSR